MYFFASIILLSSCALLGPKNRPSPEPKVKPKAPDEVVVDKKPVLVDDEKVDTIAVATIDKASAKKDKYSIAILLPFSTDEGELLKLMSDNNVTGYQPLASLEFYEGALMALDTLKSLGVNLNINVYNNLRDSLSTALLMRKEAIKTSDLIIGPVFNDGLKAAAPIALQNKTYIVSPLSPINIFADTNKYFIMGNPTIAAQLAASVEFVLKTNPKANIITVYRADKSSETRIASDIKAAFDTSKIAGAAKFYEVANFSGLTEKLIDEGNYVFICGNDELYVNGLIRDLSKSSREKDITLVGLQNLLSMESISLDYFENLHLHYPTGYWVNQDAPLVKSFNQTFIQLYSTRPSEFAYRGYDLMLYFGSMLNAYGANLSNSCGNPNPMQAKLLYPIKFKTIKNANGDIEFIENSNITILKYDQFRFEKANDN